MLKWGLTPSWTKDPSLGHKIINARSESIHEKPAFRQATRYHRCIIPSSGFFEWEEKEGKKTPLYVRFKDGSPMCFAGIWGPLEISGGGGRGIVQHADYFFEQNHRTAP